MILAFLWATPMQGQEATAFDPPSFDKFIGYYQMAPEIRPNTVVTVSREGEHFFLKQSRQQATEIFPESPTSFFMRGLPVKISFEMGTNGRATGLLIHESGRDGRASRIDEAAAKAIEALPPPQPKGHMVPRTWTMMHGIVPRMLTSADGTALDYWPCFSPDGKTVLFSRTRDGGKSWDLTRVLASGGDAVPFFAQSLPVSATRADWGKNGKVAFTGTASDGSSSVWIADGDGKDAHPVPVSGASDQFYYPSWYPDGKSLAVLDPSARITMRIDAVGGAASKLTDPAQVMTGMSSVSPDGSAIAFAGQKNSGQSYNQNENGIWIWTAGATAPVENPPIQGRTPAWSPDGKHIVFESDRGSPDGNYAIFIVNRDGTGLVQVTDYGLNANHPVWSRDGKHMVFSTGDPGKKISTIAVIDLP